jgi:hypothetical protein
MIGLPWLFLRSSNYRRMLEELQAGDKAPPLFCNEAPAPAFNLPAFAIDS